MRYKVLIQAIPSHSIHSFPFFFPFPPLPTSFVAFYSISPLHHHHSLHSPSHEYQRHHWFILCFLLVQEPRFIKAKGIGSGGVSTPAKPEKIGECMGCGVDLMGGSPYLTAANGKWHPDCFRCTKCNDKLQGKGYSRTDKGVICRSCAKKNQKPSAGAGKTTSGSATGLECAECGNGISGEAVFWKQQNKTYHQECFKCGKCRKRIDTKGGWYKLKIKDPDTGQTEVLPMCYYCKGPPTVCSLQ